MWNGKQWQLGTQQRRTLMHVSKYRRSYDEFIRHCRWRSIRGHTCFQRSVWATNLWKRWTKWVTESVKYRRKEAIESVDEHNIVSHRMSESYDATHRSCGWAECSDLLKESLDELRDGACCSFKSVMELNARMTEAGSAEVIEWDYSTAFAQSAKNSCISWISSIGSSCCNICISWIDWIGWVDWIGLTGRNELPNLMMSWLTSVAGRVKGEYVCEGGVPSDHPNSLVDQQIYLQWPKWLLDQ